MNAAVEGRGVETLNGRLKGDEVFRKLFGLGDAVTGQCWVGCDARGRRDVGVVGACVCIDYPIGAELFSSLVKLIPVVLLRQPAVGGK